MLTINESMNEFITIIFIIILYSLIDRIQIFFVFVYNVLNM